MDQEGIIAIAPILSSPSHSGEESSSDRELDLGRELSPGGSAYILKFITFTHTFLAVSDNIARMQEKMDEMAKSIKILNAEIDRLTKQVDSMRERLVPETIQAVRDVEAVQMEMVRTINRAADLFLGGLVSQRIIVYGMVCFTSLGSAVCLFPTKIILNYSLMCSKC